MKYKNIELSCLTEKQAAKWFLLHERARHFADIEQINKDLEKLKEIEVPDELVKLVSKKFDV